MKYVIIGNGVAGTTAAANIRKTDSEGRITIISEEQFPFYSRIRLTEFISGEADENGLLIKKDIWYEKNKIELVLNTIATDINKDEKEVITSSGDVVRYDRLLLAAGGLPFVPNIPGVNKKGVFTLRTLKDAIEIREHAKKLNLRVLLIGGGVLGLEVGNSIRKLENNIMVIEFFPRLLPRQMDAEGAEILKTQMEKMGFRFYLGLQSKEIIGRDRAEALLLEDSTVIDCDMIIISAGIKPNLSLAQKLGLNIEKSLIVSDRMETSIRDIYAAGDLIRHNNISYGIWHAAEKQGETAGVNMAGGNAFYKGTAISNTLKIAGIDLVSAGDIDAEGKKESIVAKDSENYVYKKIVIKDNTVIGAILYGDIKDRRKILKAIEDKKNIEGIREELEHWNLENL